MSGRGMDRVLELVEERSVAFAREPFQRFLQDTTVSPDSRMSFALGMTHFVMSFVDICALVLHEEPASSRYQEIVNEHAKEDGDHYLWFLNDLRALGYDPTLSFTDAVRVLWGPELAMSRLLTYRLSHLGYRASPLQKLVLVVCMEATAKIGFANTSRVARIWAETHGERLGYLGGDHVAAEEGHSIRGAGAVAILAEADVDEATVADLTWVVGEAFEAFTDFTAELLRFPGSAADHATRATDRRTSGARDARPGARATPGRPRS